MLGRGIFPSHIKRKEIKSFENSSSSNSSRRIVRIEEAKRGQVLEMLLNSVSSSSASHTAFRSLSKDSS